MGTKLAEAQGIGTADAAWREWMSARAERLSKILKDKLVSRGLLLAGDALALLLAHGAAAGLVEHLFRVPSAALNPPNYVAFYLPFLLLVLFLFGRNQRLDLRRPEKELELAVKGVSLAFLLLVCANFMVFKTGFSRYLMVIWYLVALGALLGVRFVLRLAYGALWQRGIARKNTLLMGSAAKIFELEKLLSIQRYHGYELLGVVPAGEDAPESVARNGLPVLGSLARWQEIARESRTEQVIVVLEERTPEAHRLVSDVLKRCLADGIDVQVYSDVFASRDFNYELDEFSGFFRFFAAPRWSQRLQMAGKKALNFAAGAVGGLLTLLLSPLVALLIKAEDNGPVFHRREFVDCDGSVRYYLKFRTMYTNADEILKQDDALKARFGEKHKLPDDPRVTRVGRLLRKYSIDEWPQFFSLLRGDLALVGPRVISHEEMQRYGADLPKLLSVKPGLTGVWQVMGRQLTTYQERIQMDMFYIDHWSIWLDLWIVAKTFWKVIRAEGAF